LCLTDWQKDFGGYTSYIAEGEDEEVCCLRCFCYLSAFGRSIVFSPTFVSVSEHNNSNGKGLIFMNIWETGRQWTKEKLDFWKVKVNVWAVENPVVY